MESKIENLPKSKVKAKIKLEYSEFKKYVDDAFNLLSSGVEIKGFRAGKAPRHLLEEKIGKDRIFQEALEKAIPETLSKALAKESCLALDSPKVSIGKYPAHDDPKESLEFTAEVEIMPRFELSDYKKIKVKKVDPEKVSEKEIDKVLDNLRQSHATFEKVTRGAEKGDRVEIDFAGKIGGVKIDKLSSKNHPFIVGEGYFIPEFEKNLAGIKENEEKKFQIKIDDKVQDPDIAGRLVDFEVKVNSVQKVILPEVNDDFAKKLGKKNVGELKEGLKESIEKQKEIEAEQKTQKALLDALTAKTIIDLPQILIDREKDRIIGNIKADIEMRGMSFGDYLNSIKKTEEDLRKDLEGQAANSVKVALVINKVREEEKIEVSKDEVDSELDALIKAGQPLVQNSESSNYVASRILGRKTIQKLKDYMIK